MKNILEKKKQAI